MKRWTTLVAVVALAAATGTASAASPPAGTITVAGLAGTMTDITVAAKVRITLDDIDAQSSADRGGWSGVLIVAANGTPATRPLLLSVVLDESLRCPAAHCPYGPGGGPPVMTNSVDPSETVLPAGRYHVILAGAAQAHVRATLTAKGLRGRRTLATDAKPVRYVAEVTTGMGATGHETQLHAFTQMPAGGEFGLAALFDSIDVAPAGGYLGMGCATAGSSNMTTRSIGGTAPCADLQGDDVLFGPWAGPATDQVAYEPVQVPALGMWGPSDLSFGIGYDQSAAAPSSFLRSLFIGVETH